MTADGRDGIVPMDSLHQYGRPVYHPYVLSKV